MCRHYQLTVRGYVGFSTASTMMGVSTFIGGSSSAASTWMAFIGRSSSAASAWMAFIGCSSSAASTLLASIGRSRAETSTLMGTGQLAVHRERCRPLTHYRRSVESSMAVEFRSALVRATITTTADDSIAAPFKVSACANPSFGSLNVPYFRFGDVHGNGLLA